MTAKGLEAVDKKEDKTENNDDSTDDVIKDFKKSKDQILKEKEQKLKELRDIDKELQNRNDSIQRYHYQPDNPRKTEGKKTLQSAVQLPKTESLIRMSDLIMLRFPI
jgi:septation ring formation regulator EzrA